MTIAPFLSDERRRAMAASGAWGDRTLLDAFEAVARATPARPAVISYDTASGGRIALSYGELAARVEWIAAGLARLGIGAGDIVAFQLPNWWQFVAIHLAALRIGAVSNPLMPIFREHELTFMLRLAEARLLIVPARFRGFDHEAMALGLREAVPSLRHVLAIGGSGETAFETLLDAPASALEGRRRAGPDAVIQLLYTSGTTGEPKGAMHTSNTLLHNVDRIVERLGLSDRDVGFMASPLAHQTGFLIGMMLPLWLGARAVLQDVWNPAAAVQIIGAEGVTFTMASTPFLADLARAAEGRAAEVASLRVFISAGAPIPRVLVRQATEVLGAHVVSGWGMTEVGLVTMATPGDPPEKAFETDGGPVPASEVRVVDANGAALPAGTEGRLQSRGPSTFVGYLKRPQWYGVDAEGWFETGDLARLDADGYLRITGRSKDIIIRGGENVPVVEVEQLIYRHPAVLEVAIVGMPDARLGERACAFVVLRGGTALGFPELRAWLEQNHVAKNYWPERLEVTTELPKTPSGKVQKFRLRELAKRFAPQ